MTDKKKCAKIGVYGNDCTLLGYVFSYTPYYNERLAQLLYNVNELVGNELRGAPFDEYDLEEYQQVNYQEY